MYHYLFYYQLHPQSWLDSEEVEELLASLGVATKMHPMLIRLETEEANVHSVHQSILKLFRPNSGNVYYLTEIPEFLNVAGQTRLARFTNIRDWMELENDD